MIEVSSRVRARLPRRRFANVLKRIERLYSSARRFASLSLIVTTDQHIKTLNRRYRHQNKITDVLSFDYGEIVISYPAAKRQARRHRVSLADELCLLFVHGFLHILGFDHHTKKEREKMAKAELNILGFSGLVGRAASKKF